MEQIKLNFNSNDLNVKIDNINNINNEISTDVFQINAKVDLQGNNEKFTSSLNANDKNLLSNIEKSELQETQNHAWLKNLDYENSGHTGFASAEQVRLLLPKDISVLPKNDLTNRNAKIYIYDPSLNIQETQVSVGDLFDSKIKTVQSVPDNLQTNDYIFLEVK